MAGYVMCKRGQLFKREQGNILVVFTIGLFALIAMAALAIDGGHMLLHKTRLQNIADAAALHAAKTLDEGGSHQDAREAVIEIIGLNLAHRDNHEIQDALDLPDPDAIPNAIQVTTEINVDFSEEPDPFISSTSEDADYVKVEIRNLNLNNFLADIMNFSKRVSATALAGATPAIDDCPANILPLVLCADDVSGGYPYGLTDPDNLYVLKIGSNTESPIGPGNFQLLDLPGKLKDQLAGGYANDSCYVNAEDLVDIDTKPGNTASVSKAMNTRMGIHKGEFSSEEDYPGDWNTCQGEELVEIYIDKDVGDIVNGVEVTEAMSGTIIESTKESAYTHSQYISELADVADGGTGSCPDGFSGDIDKTITNGFERRVFNIVVAQCEEGSTGKTTFVDGTWDVGCFFLTQQMVTDGTGQDVYIIGELIEECSGKGADNGIADDTPGPHEIVLYHVPGSKDS